MKKMFKIIAMLLVIATVVFAAGCADKAAEPATTEEGASEEVTDETVVADATLNENETMADEAAVDENETMVDDAAVDENETMVDDAAVDENETMVDDAAVDEEVTDDENVTE